MVSSSRGWGLAMLVTMTIERLEEGDEFEIEGLPGWDEELDGADEQGDVEEGDIGGEEAEGVRFYRVASLEKFFQVYSFGPGERDAIRQRWNDGGTLVVRQDGSVVWGDGEELVGGAEDLIDEGEFAWERRLVGCGAE